METNEEFPRRASNDGFFCRFTFGQFFALLLLEVFTLFFIFYLGARYGREFFNIGGTQPVQAVQAAPVEEEKRHEFLQDSVISDSQDPSAQAMADDLIAKAGTPELKEKIAEMLKSKSAESASPVNEGIVIVGNPPASQIPVQNQPAPQELTPAQTPATSSGKVTIITADGESKTIDEATAYNQVPASANTASTAQTPANAGAPLEPQGAVKFKNSEASRFSIQVGSYPQLEEANSAVETWKNKGYPAYMMIADIPDRGRWYRVRIGGFSEKQDADAYLAELSGREKVDALVVYNEQ